MDKNNNIDKSISNLKEKFLSIRGLGYVKSIRNGPTGVGATFEFLLGKKEDKLQTPDFEGIEIKTRRAYSKSLISLFNATPSGSTDNETKRLRDTYGYPDRKDKSLKRLAGKVNACDMTKIGLFYSYQLKVDRKKKKVILCIYDWNEVCIDESSYWEFSTLKEKLLQKLNVLALIKAWTNKIDGVEAFKYYKMNIFILKDFECFLKALEDGSVQVSFKIGNHYDEKYYGRVHAHGVGFSISEDNLYKIFDIYR